ncbi:hypothetical protein DPEC_G00211230 [Dallia pectoralis]|uniref:Uncharacterized protein n=1 Tax=Dallia pectoralis TaxID=75939 RepID=A0ACC2G639_DALPE|nr:hypothetical protein DPEC_G00211230 [Dallia pectoralis]
MGNVSNRYLQGATDVIPPQGCASSTSTSKLPCRGIVHCFGTQEQLEKQRICISACCREGSSCSHFPICAVWPIGFHAKTTITLWVSAVACSFCCTSPASHKSLPAPPAAEEQQLADPASTQVAA